jgi:hypothetical protein
MVGRSYENYEKAQAQRGKEKTLGAGYGFFHSPGFGGI